MILSEEQFEELIKTIDDYISPNDENSEILNNIKIFSMEDIEFRDFIYKKLYGYYQRIKEGNFSRYLRPRLINYIKELNYNPLCI